MPRRTKPAPAEDRALTEMQTRFVGHYVMTGGKLAEATKLAGYKGKHASSRGAQMLRLPHVRKAIAKLAVDSLNLELMVKALGKVEELLDAESEQVQMYAAKDLLDRAGFRAAERSEVRVTGSISIDLRPPSARSGNDGTQSSELPRGEGGSKTPKPHSPTPQAPTIEAEYTEVKE